jgi:hypothetical protein
MRKKNRKNCRRRCCTSSNPPFVQRMNQRASLPARSIEALCVPSFNPFLEEICNTRDSRISYGGLAVIFQDVVHSIGTREGGWPTFGLHYSHGGCPSLRFLQGWAAMLPAQLLPVLHRPLCTPSSHPPFSPTRRTGHPHLWWLLQFESRATRPAHPQVSGTDPRCFVFRARA